MVDHYPLFEFLHAANYHHVYKIKLLVALCYVTLASPPRHQHLWCFHYFLVVADFDVKAFFFFVE